MPRRSSLVCFCALVLGLGACVPAEEEDQFVRYKSDTTMGRIQDRGELVAGIDPSLPPFSDTSDSFVVEFARYLADELRVELKVVEIDSESALSAVKKGEADIVFPLIPITERLARQNAFTTPYWVGHQRLLAGTASGIETVEDLAGKVVCEGPAADSSINIDVSELGSGADVTSEGDCSESLRAGSSDAVTGPDPYLISVASQLPGTAIVGEELTTFGYGAVVRKGAADMQDFVSGTLGESKSEGKWLKFFNDHISEYANATDPTAPDLTLEEAATLYPRELEQADQG